MASCAGYVAADVHLLMDSRGLGARWRGRICTWCAGRTIRTGRGRSPAGSAAVPLDFLVVRAFDTYEFERMRVPRAADSDFVFVNLFREPLGAPMRPDAIGELMAAASRRAGFEVPVRAHQLRHACASNIADAGAGIDVVAELLGHAGVSSSRVYMHPDSSRLRAAVERVPSPRERAGVST